MTPKNCLSVKILSVLLTSAGLFCAAADVSAINVGGGGNYTLAVEAGQAATKKVSGTITDTEGVPVTGASVIIKGTRTGTESDLDGRFSIDASVGTEISVQLIGFKDYVFTVGGQSIYNIVLEQDSKFIDEAVVTGYAVQKKVNLTGAVDVVKEDAFKNRSATTVSQLLQGQVPGLTGFEAGQNGFEPGASMSFNVRGQGSAYVLIDGVEGDLNRINPSDIASVSVLKDASASAIYGSRAAYGVILITTKSGQSGKPKVSFNAQYSMVTPHNMPDMVDSYTFVKMINEAAVNGGKPMPYNADYIQKVLAWQADHSLPETAANKNGNWTTGYADHDWYEVFFGGFGMRNQENIQISGGSKDVKYFVSVGHNYDDGIINYGIDNYRRLNFNSKIDASLAKWWKFSSNTSYSRTIREYPNYDNQGDYDLLMHQLARTMPIQAMKSPNGVYTIQSKIPWTESGTDKNVGNVFTQRFATDIQLLPGWKLKADFSFRIEGWQWTSVNKAAYEDKEDGSLVVSGSTLPTSVGKSQTQKGYLTSNVYTTYDHEFKNGHAINFMAGFQIEDYINDKIEGSKKDMITEFVPSFSTSTGDITLSDAISHWSMAGAFVRLGYNYKERYLFEANVRADGTSKFAKGRKWGIFPSFSIGWNVANEEFFKRATDKVDMLKIRASWGQLGNQNVSAYQDLPLLGTKSNLGWIINGARPDYTTAPNLINRELTWETSESMNLGVDLAAFNGRFTFTGDIYQRMTRDRLGPAEALPGVIGASLPKANNSTLRTRGWEIAIGWRDQLPCGFGYSVKGSLSDYQSVVTEYNNPTNLLTTEYVGKRVGDYWGYVTEGFIMTQEEADRITKDKTQSIFYKGAWNVGDIKYKDLDGKPGISMGSNTLDDPGDRKVIGNSTPRYQFGITIGLEYKGIDFSMFWQGIAKRDLVLNGNMFYGFQAGGQESLFTEHMDYFRSEDIVYDGETAICGLGPNTDAYYPRPYRDKNMSAKNQQTQSRYIQNGAYGKLRNLQLGYTLPKKWMDAVRLERMRIYFSGDNLCTITGKGWHSSMDPETAYKGKRGNGKSYFSQSVFSFGIDITF